MGKSEHIYLDKKYTNHLLNLANEEKNRHWATICLRAAVFSKDLELFKWVLSMHEVKLTREELENATKNFKNQNQKESLKDKMVDFLEKFKLSSSTSN